MTQLAMFSSKITDNLGPNRPNPLGNIGHSHETHRKRQIALYDVEKHRIAQTFSTVSQITGLPPRLTISYDGGTAYKDNKRQIVVATYIDAKGQSKDVLISAKALSIPGAVGNTQHVLDCGDIIPLENIIFTCSDDEPRYEGPKGGVCALLRKDAACSDKLIRLSDVCHRLERLVLPSKPCDSELWVSEALRNINSLVNV